MEKVLGSSEAHQQAGIIWFGGFPIFAGVFLYLSYTKNTFAQHENEEKMYIGLPVRAAHDVVESLTGDKQVKEQSDLQSKWVAYGGCFVFLFLIVFAMVTGVLIKECQDRGECQY